MGHFKEKSIFKSWHIEGKAPDQISNRKGTDIETFRIFVQKFLAIPRNSQDTPRIQMYGKNEKYQISVQRSCQDRLNCFL